MKAQLSLLTIALLAACGPSETTPSADSNQKTAQAIPINLPDTSELLESRNYTLVLNNAEDYASVVWEQTSGTDYGWSLDSGVVTVEIPQLPVGFAETLSFQITATSQEGAISVLSYDLTVRSNDRVLYLVTHKDTGNATLWSYNAETGNRTQLSAGSDWTGVSHFIPSPDGEWVAYVADENVDGRFELFVTSVDGGETKLASTDFLQANAGISSPTWTDDSQSLIYRLDDAVDNQHELYHYNRVEHLITQLSQELVEGGSVMTFKLSPDQDAVAYLTDAEVDEIDELYVLDLNTFTRTKLNGTMVAGGNVSSQFHWSPDGSRIAFLSDAQTDGQYELFSVAADGSNRVKVNDSLVAGGDVHSYFYWVPDSSGLLYRADNAVDSQFNLFYVDASGNGRIQINDTLVAGGTVSSMLMHPNGISLLFTGDVNTDGVYELYSANVNGGSLVRLNDTLSETADVVGYWWAGETETVVYRADVNADARYELFAIDKNGSNRRQVSKVLGGGDNPDMNIASSSVQFSADGEQLFYTADQYIDNVSTLFRADLLLDTTYDVLLGVNAQAHVTEYDLANDGHSVSSLLSMPSTAIDLMISAVDGSDNNKINNSQYNGGYVEVATSLWSKDSSRIVYIANEMSDNYGLFLANPETLSRERIDGIADEKHDVTYVYWID